MTAYRQGNKQFAVWYGRHGKFMETASRDDGNG